ncbi:MAG: hypothetical protein RSN88_06660 [Gordonibacter sp.]|uniref:hypothetical protein n=1 Tax=Gordonibacter sp. TaxID=1968902 RepID=UPI002FC8085D
MGAKFSGIEVTIAQALKRIGPCAAAAALAADPLLRKLAVEEHSRESFTVLNNVLNDVVLEMVEEGFSDSDIAARTGYSRRTISRRRQEIGLEPNSPQRLWSAREEALLRHLSAQNYTDKEIGEKIGRTEGAVRNRRKDIGIQKKVCKPWEDEQIEKLVELWNTDTPIDKICTLCGCRTRSAVRNKAKKVGIADGTRNDLMRKIVNREFLARGGAR